MNLQHLRDEVPLTQFDYAAVRARVRAEIALRQRRAWVFRFASAVVAATLAVLALIPVHPARTPDGVVRAELVVTALDCGSCAAAFPHRYQSGGVAAAVQRVPKVRRRHVKNLAPEVAAVSRIEIHTADPDVRIIWIVPKENS